MNSVIAAEPAPQGQPKPPLDRMAPQASAPAVGTVNGQAPATPKKPLVPRQKMRVSAPEGAARILRLERTMRELSFTRESDIRVTPIRAIYDPPYPDSYYGLAQVEGRLTVKGRSLAIGSQAIPIDASGKFQALLPIQGEKTDFIVYTVDPQGRSGRELITVVVRDWQEWIRMVKEGRPPKRLHFRAGLGLSYQTYVQPGMSTLAQVAITPRLGVTYEIAPGKWDITANVASNAYAPAVNSASYQFREFSANLRLRFILPAGALGLPPTWRISLLGGGYYATTFVVPSAFGYKNLMGPELFPSISRSFANGGNIVIYAKYSPAMDINGFYTLGQGEYAAGLKLKPNGTTRLSYTLDGVSRFLRASQGNMESLSVTGSVMFDF